MLTGTGTYNGSVVMESNAATPALSTCNWPAGVTVFGNWLASPYLLNLGSSANLGQWTVGGTPVVPSGTTGTPIGNYKGVKNTYGDDGITIPIPWLPAIRANVPIPCTLTFYQDMSITSNGKSSKYTQQPNEITITVNANSVVITRATARVTSNH